MIFDARKETVDALGYELQVYPTGICVRLDVTQDGDLMELSLYPEESKALRKALKRAEKLQAASR